MFCGVGCVYCLVRGVLHGMGICVLFLFPSLVCGFIRGYSLSGGGGSGRFLIPGGFNGMFRGNRSSFPLTGKNPLVILERGRVPVFGSF